MTLRVTTNKGEFEFKVERFYTLAQIKASAGTHFGRFAELHGHVILSRQFCIKVKGG